MTYSRLNSSAATLTKNRTDDSVSPMQPSTQVVHIPLKGLMASSVRFLVRVAAEELSRE